MKIPKTDKWMALILVVLATFLAMSLTNDIQHRHETFKEQAKIVANQHIIISNQYQILKKMGIEFPTNIVVVESSTNSR